MKLTASNSDFHIHPTAHGPVVITEGILPTVATGKKIISLEPSTGSVKWLRVSNTLGPVERSTGLRSEEPRTVTMGYEILNSLESIKSGIVTKRVFVPDPSSQSIYNALNLALNESINEILKALR